ncbi:hypothetical protein FZEAL_5256 [Fusarium zealandicum]|uniref:Nephrocystin 3-like N-terminal domain-containing protein n=1 Tax=Fusarium zealandicum TaxID=1053134 RepID=A0A8H4XL09_9HYPO|nr:hypothetical protein FZEAL_5256 [Fusarium zealandicum]
MKTQLNSPDFYTIGWISALPIERAAATALLDDRHETPKGFYQQQTDANSYTWGRIGEHNVVIASLPARVYGKVSAATTASNLVRSLPQIRIGLLVGIGSGIPNPDHGQDVRLGDIVVSQPDGTTGGVVQYDLGKARPNHIWERKGSLNMPPMVLLHALAGLQAEHEMDGSQVPELLQAMWTSHPRMARPSGGLPGYVHQGFENDRLFKASYNHSGNTCDDCDPLCEIERDLRDTTDPKIHYGIIASGDTLVNDAVTRDAIVETAGAECICFEMEAAGLMNYFPCLVIRGICAYADSHKNDRWQRYASATAAAYAKELLGFVPTTSLKATQRALEVVNYLENIQDTVSDTRTDVKFLSTTILHTELKTTLASLSTAREASFDSCAEDGNPTCLDDTRVDLLNHIYKWAENSSGPSIFWLNGMAGTGKSTISRTVCRYFDRAGYLGASFFFKRGEDDRGRSTKFFPTIADQLAAKNHDVAQHIVKAINADSAIGSKGPRIQFEKLISEPLSAVLSRTEQIQPIIIVIDALDECDEDENRIKLIIHLLHHTKSLALKIFLTSRPELPIRLGFQDIKSLYQDLILHEIPAPVIEHDLDVFFKHQLMTIRSKHNASVSRSREAQLPEDWPTDSDVKSLVKMAAPLFIFASNVCLLLGDPRCGSPDQLLQDVLKPRTKGNGSQLDATYLPVLERLANGLPPIQRGIALGRFRDIVGSIVILADPLSVTALANIISVPLKEVESHLSLLHSILEVPNSPKSPVRLLHLSFRDFLLNSEQGQNDFSVDETTAHAKLAIGCLKTMNDSLQEDICGLRPLGKEGSTADSQTVDACISKELMYACRHWVYHAQESRYLNGQSDEVHSFLKVHFLHWVEVLCLMGRATDSLGMVRSLLDMAQDKDDKELHDFLEDALRILQANVTILGTAPLQIYSSALLFAPQSSVVKRVFNSKIPTWIVGRPRVDHTGECLNEYEGWDTDDEPSLYDGLVALSRSPMPMACLILGNRIWWRLYTDTSEPIEISKKVNGLRSDVAISHDLSLIAAAQPRELIWLWSTDTGDKIQVLQDDGTGYELLKFSHKSEFLT